MMKNSEEQAAPSDFAEMANAHLNQASIKRCNTEIKKNT